MVKKLSFRAGYLVVFTILLIIEVLIALFVRDSFIRPYGGDLLVVILVYFFVRIWYRGSKKLLPVYVFLFAFLVEILQWANITNLLNLKQNSALATAIGTSFDWWDVGCYFVGVLIIYVGANWKEIIKQICQFRRI